MGYKILSRVIELTDDSSISLDERLKKVARLIIRQFPVDSCCVYIWEKKEKHFRMTAAAGAQKACVNVYGKKSGIPGRVKRLNRALEVSKTTPEDKRWGTVSDRGLSGFRGAAAYPLREGKNCYGVLYLKSEKKLKFSERDKKIFSVISRQIASSIKSEQNYTRLKNEHNKLKDLQLRLVSTEKFMALGELSAALAHEIRNPLVSIGGFATRLKKKFPPDSPYLPYVDHIAKEVVRLEGIIDDILNFVDHKKIKLHVEKLNSVVNDSLWLFEEACRSHNIAVKKSLSKETLRVVADTPQLKIAFDNLIANAIQSMERGGTLTVTTKKSNGCGVVEIKDTGGGVEPRIVGNIFNPFYTTKKAGMGLGLTITHNIITRHKGMIDVINDYGKGITFTVKLPCAGKPVKEDRA